MSSKGLNKHTSTLDIPHLHTIWYLQDFILTIKFGFFEDFGPNCSFKASAVAPPVQTESILPYGGSLDAESLLYCRCHSIIGLNTLVWLYGTFKNELTLNHPALGKYCEFRKKKNLVDTRVGPVLQAVAAADIEAHCNIESNYRFVKLLNCTREP